MRAFELSQPARDKLAADGVPVATDAKAAEYGAEVVISMLPASQPASQHVDSQRTNHTTPMATLLIIDMQVGMTWPAAAARNNPGAEAAMAHLLAHWRQSGSPVVHVRHMSRTPTSPFWPGQTGAQFQPAFAPLAHEHVVEKNVTDAFTHTGLERWLHARGQSTVVIVGVSTPQSVQSTARTAGNLGLKTYVVSDASFAFDTTDLRGVHWPAEDVHALTLAQLHGEHATVVTTEQAMRLA